MFDGSKIEVINLKAQLVKVTDENGTLHFLRLSNGEVVNWTQAMGGGFMDVPEDMNQQIENDFVAYMSKPDDGDVQDNSGDNE